MVSEIAFEHDLNQDASSLRPLYAPARGCLMNILLFILLSPFLPFIFIYKLTIKIIKWVFFILKIREVALVMGNTLILGHTLERCLKDGRIPHSSENDPTAIKATYKASIKVRRLFDKTYKGSDFRLVGKLLTDLTLTILKSHKIALLGIKSIFGTNANRENKPEPPPLRPSGNSKAAHLPVAPTGAMGSESGGKPCPPLPNPETTDNGIGYFAKQLAELLNHHDMKLFIKEFDARFDIMFSRYENIIKRNSISRE